MECNAWNCQLFIPLPYKRKFLNLTAATLHRSGWLIDKAFPAKELLTDFDFVYKRTKQIEFGSYYAIRFISKAQYKISKLL